MPVNVRPRDSQAKQFAIKSELWRKIVWEHFFNIQLPALFVVHVHMRVGEAFDCGIILLTVGLARCAGDVDEGLGLPSLTSSDPGHPWRG